VARVEGGVRTVRVKAVSPHVRCVAGAVRTVRLKADTTYAAAQQMRYVVSGFSRTYR
jgi:hypothetical protein